MPALVLVPALLMALFLGSVRAEESSLEVLYKALENVPHNAYSADYVQTMEMMGVKVSSEGRVLGRRSGEMRSDIRTSTPVGEQQSLSVLGKDGILWQENNILGQKQIMKFDINALPAAMNMQGSAGVMLDRKKLDSMLGGWDMKLRDNQDLDGTPVYVIEASIKSDTNDPQLKKMAETFGKMLLYLGKKDVFMHRLEMFAPDGETPVITTEIRNIKFDMPLPDALFIYTPPEGANVMDMTDMLKKAGL